LIRAVWGSVAVYGLAPMQDFLGLGNAARMNYPGNPAGNWNWRLPPDYLNDMLVERIYQINYLFSRLNPYADELRKAKEQEEAEEEALDDSDDNPLILA
jgi:4-alpha-glucanotransferase